jgi:hypothetical protein
MELQMAFFCDDAHETPEGKLDAKGIFHDLFAPGFPARHDRMVLVIVLDWDRADEGRYKLKAELVDPDGATVLTIEGHSDVQPSPPGQPPARTRLVMPLEQAVFPRPGRYHLRATVKGTRLRGPSLHLVELQGEKAAGEE